jgi:small subunit ribosomal protein S20
MAITKSAKKALRQSLRRRIRNLVYINKIKGLLKKVRALVSQKKVEEAKALIPQIYKALDKAVKKGLIKKNTASRRKGRIVSLINKFKR